MSSMTGGDAVYHALKAANVSCVFGIPSQHNLGLYDALCRHGDIRVIGTRHEQGAVHAADGYARATGKLGVAIVSTGPGTVNAVNGLYEAGFASSPVLLLTTQIDTRYLGKGKGFIHDADQQLAMLRTVTRRSERVQHVRDVAPTILDVISNICTGRPQPGAVEIPTDLLLAPLPQQTYEYRAPEPLPVDGAALDAAAQRILQSRKPLIWVGGGCVSANAADAVRRLAEHLGAPVVSSVNGRGVLDAAHPLYVGCQTHLPAFNELLSQADMVLAIGTRFQALASQYWQQPMPKTLIHIDADAGVIGRNYPAALALVGDARLATEGLLDRIPGGQTDSEFVALARGVSQTLAQTIGGMIGADHRNIASMLATKLPADSPVVGDATITANTWGNYLLPIHQPRIGHYSTGLAIGPALPLGIGAAIGTGRKTLVIHGDGGVMLNLAEIATAVETRAPVVLCVFNDRGYGVLKGLQRISTGRPYAVDLHTPDFVVLAAAMGMPGARVSSVEGFARELDHALVREGPYLIEVDLDALEPIRLFG